MHARRDVPPPVATMRRHPAAGDLIMRHEGSRRYTLHQVPGEAQISFATREEAEDSARRFATGEGVDVWFERGDRFAPLHRFRR
jgi:hypothetical protein